MRRLLFLLALVATAAQAQYSGGGGGGSQISIAPAFNAEMTATTGSTIVGPDIISAGYTILNRKGPTADFTDTTDTAASIISSIPSGFKVSALAGKPWIFTYNNLTGYSASIAAGAGVTLVPAAPNVVIPRLSSLSFVVTQTSATTVLMSAVDASRMIAVPPTRYASVTGTAGMVIPYLNPSDISYLSRTGPTANFTDTTDTAANIVAAVPSPAAGDAIAGLTWTVRYINNTAYTATWAAGTGVTMDPNNTMSPGTFRDFMVQITATSPAAVSVVSVGGGSN
jgi:hypothetical protein